ILTPDGLPPLAEKPGVSFIMPVLNEAEHIEQAITTILAQDYDGDKEIVLALGPSSDDTNAIIESMAATDSRIQTVDNPDAATPIGLNLAIAATRHPPRRRALRAQPRTYPAGPRHPALAHGRELRRSDARPRQDLLPEGRRPCLYVPGRPRRPRLPLR